MFSCPIHPDLLSIAPNPHFVMDPIPIKDMPLYLGHIRLGESRYSSIKNQVQMKNLSSTIFFTLIITLFFHIERNTAFNNRYVLNFLFGKEWKVGASGRNVLTFDSKLATSGGRYYTPIDLEETRDNGGREVLVDGDAFTRQYDPYFRWDVKFGLRMNSKKKKISHQFFVDFQNVTNRENVFVERYN